MSGREGIRKEEGKKSIARVFDSSEENIVVVVLKKLFRKCFECQVSHKSSLPSRRKEMCLQTKRGERERERERDSARGCH